MTTTTKKQGKNALKKQASKTQQQANKTRAMMDKKLQDHLLFAGIDQGTKESENTFTLSNVYEAGRYVKQEMKTISSVLKILYNSNEQTTRIFFKNVDIKELLNVASVLYDGFIYDGKSYKGVQKREYKTCCTWVLMYIYKLTKIFGSFQYAIKILQEYKREQEYERSEKEAIIQAVKDHNEKVIKAREERKAKAKAKANKQSSTTSESK